MNFRHHCIVVFVRFSRALKYRRVCVPVSSIYSEATGKRNSTPPPPPFPTSILHYGWSKRPVTAVCELPSLPSNISARPRNVFPDPQSETLFSVEALTQAYDTHHHMGGPEKGSTAEDGAQAMRRLGRWYWLCTAHSCDDRVSLGRFFPHFTSVSGRGGHR